MAAKDKKQDLDELDAPPKKKSKKKLVIIIIILMLLGGGGAAAFWFLKLRDPDSADVVPEPTGQEASAQAQNGLPPNTVEAPRMLTPSDSPRQLTIVKLPDMTVNLLDASGDRFLKIGMEVEVSVPEAATEIQAQMPRVRDAMIILLSSKRYSELSTAEGKMQLKNDIADRLNGILGVPRVVRVYYTDFVVQ